MMEQSEHTSLFLELTAAFGPMFLVIFGGIIAIYTRITRMETKVEPLWKEFLKTKG